MPATTPTKRISFSTIKDQLDYPDFLDIQLKSFFEFFRIESTAEERKKEKLYQVFTENFPISDTRNNFKLEFKDYSVDPPRYTIEECLERGLTYSVPLKARLKLSCNDPEHVDFETVEQDVYPFPGCFPAGLVQFLYPLSTATQLCLLAFFFQDPEFIFKC